MSVLIRGMEMPTLYRTYKVRFSESSDGKIIVGIANEDSTAYRPIGEAVPVPPHGDLVDRHKLMQFPIRRDHYDKENGNEHFINGIETVMEWIDAAPVVIPTEDQ